VNIIPKKYEGETVVVVATGPSLDTYQCDYVGEARRLGKCRVLTINNSFLLCPFSDIHVACNDDWWDYYWNHPMLSAMRAEKWTRYEHQAKKYNINYIESIKKIGLSKDPSVVHINKGSGPMAINFATLYGFSKIVLLGHDMTFAPDYNGSTKNPGSTPRHFFGEYPEVMQHFPKAKESIAPDGTIIGLIDAYKNMLPDLKDIDVVNCTPGSRLNTFRHGFLEKEV
jgi:hypothetical protein